MTTVIPEGLTDYKERTLPDGSLITFEYAEVGTLKRTGQPRKVPWRAYYWHPTNGKRQRMLSVTTLLDAILPKPGIPPWAEAHGIKGTMEAMRLGLMRPGLDPVQVVRGNRLGADAARDEAAGRGLNIHALLEEYMLTGDAPQRPDNPEHHGYHRALCRWLLKTNPEPESIEEMVCDPIAGYAGRSDLVARVHGFRTRFDAKTSATANIFSSAHLQCLLYERGAIFCGAEPCDRLSVIVFAADGEYREMPCAADHHLADVALEYARYLKPVDSACASANRREKEARR